ncbi:hypothetical protein [Halalkalirubrum salinum]|uniref:hypothetical protein n=1 Tax=Halalkalirubrum salinum TaxID=2563889 RepID=UPI0010FB27E8|nr:hypothetical protein [Halalkalirubrum salinum]
MAELAYLLIVGAIAIQIPIGILMYFDAKRLNLKSPDTYWLGVIVPAAGFIVILYYVSERKRLPKKETDNS